MKARNIERWVWYAFLASMAWQTRIILWHSGRAFIEWQSASLYLSDILMIALFVFAIVGKIKIQSPRSILFLFFVCAAISLFNADNVIISVYQLVRLAQFITFFLYVRYWALKRFDLHASAAAFVLGALVQAGLGITQYVLQHDVGVRWLGETLLNADMRGVAVFFDSGGDKILRAYGTLPHPNVLAAYLMVALWLTAWLWMQHDPKNHTKVWPLTFSVLLIAFYLTFSRTIIALWLVASLAMLFVLRRSVAKVVFATCIVSIAFAVILWPQVSARIRISSSEEAVQMRISYARNSLASGGGRFLNLNWFGVGIGNFTTWLARTQPTLPAYYIQPAHNLYLLIYSELGIMGVVSFLLWLGMLIRQSWYMHANVPRVRLVIISVLGAFCCIALFDHFFWTLQQGRILWWLVSAFAIGAPLARIDAHERSH